MKRDTHKVPQDRTVYDAIEVYFELWGVDDDQAHELVEIWKRD